MVFTQLTDFLTIREVPQLDDSSVFRAARVRILHSAEGQQSIVWAEGPVTNQAHLLRECMQFPARSLCQIVARRFGVPDFFGADSHASGLNPVDAVPSNWPTVSLRGSARNARPGGDPDI